MNLPCCSVVIRCYNEEQHIGRLLDGIQQQMSDSVEIIVVDSGSTDRTVAIAQQYPIKLVSIRPEEFSFGRSLNLGCQEASADYIVVASAHVYPVYRDWLEQLLQPFADPEIALVYGKQRGDTITKYSEHQIFAAWFAEESNSRQSHPFCNNANAAIRRSLWEQLRYDETLTGLEDLDWAKRAIQQGYGIAYNAAAEIVHVHNETPQHVYNRYRREAIALKQIFPQEHFNLWDLVRLFATNTFSDYYHAYHDRVLPNHLLSIPTFRLMQFVGTYRGFAQRVPLTSQLKQTFYYPRHLKHFSSSPIAETQQRTIDYSQNQDTFLKQIH